MTLSIGVDIGQQRDKSAIVAVSAYLAAPPEPDESLRRHRSRQRHLDIVHIGTLRPGVTYGEQVRQIAAIADSLAGDEKPQVWADQTGVGRPIVEMLRDACPYSVFGVTATGGVGEVVRHGSFDLSVPKSVLIGGVQVALETRRLHCDEDLALAAELRKELAAFAFELSETGRPTFGGKGEHDDLVSALALGIFGAETGAGAIGVFKEYIAARLERRANSDRVPVNVEQL